MTCSNSGGEYSGRPAQHQSGQRNGGTASWRNGERELRRGRHRQRHRRHHRPLRRWLSLQARPRQGLHAPDRCRGGGRLYEAMGPAIERSGGSVANTIAGLASFGAKCGFIGRVAADQFGGIFRHDIRSLGVAYDTPPAADGAPTARCLILVTPDGERTMNTFLGASVDFAADDLDAPLIEAARIVYLEGYLFDRERGQGRLPRGGAAGQEGRRQGRAQPVRCLLRRPPPRRFPRAGPRRRRHRLRQREGDHHPLRGEQLRGGRRRGACRLRDGGAHPLGGRLGDRGRWRDHRHSARARAQGRRCDGRRRPLRRGFPLRSDQGAAACDLRAAWAASPPPR